MKTFEERLTAWIDGRLEGGDLTAFEAELASHPDALNEKKTAHQLGDVLRTHLAAPPLPNADFFNHQLLERMRSEETGGSQAPLFRWPILRMAWAGAFCLLMALVLYGIIIPSRSVMDAPPAPYFAEVIDVRAPDPAIYATAIRPQDDLTVVWLDGLEYLPETYALK